MMNQAITPNKNLGQHWLFDRDILCEIVDYAKVSRTDTVLEIGPGLGTLTAELLSRGCKVFAVEFDENLAENLNKNIAKILPNFPNENLMISREDFLKFDLGKLPSHYKIVANIPYNITSPIIAKILTAKNPPTIAVLLVQKEVAERIVAKPGELSMLAIRTQVFAECSLGIEVSPDKFTPPPEVDSQVLILIPHVKSLIREFCEQEKIANEELFAKTFWRIISAGFANKRKKIRSSLAGGLNFAKPQIDEILHSVNINPNLRAQDLAIDYWLKLAKAEYEI